MKTIEQLTDSLETTDAGRVYDRQEVIDIFIDNGLTEKDAFTVLKKENRGKFRGSYVFNTIPVEELKKKVIRPKKLKGEALKSYAAVKIRNGEEFILAQTACQSEKIAKSNLEYFLTQNPKAYVKCVEQVK